MGLCCCFFKICPPLFPLASVSLVGGPIPHPCVIRESMSSAPQSQSAFIRKHDSLGVSSLIGVETFVFNKQAPSCVVNISFVILMRAKKKINSADGSPLLQLMFVSFHPWPRLAPTMKAFGNAAMCPCWCDRELRWFFH